MEVKQTEKGGVFFIYNSEGKDGGGLMIFNKEGRPIAEIGALEQGGILILYDNKRNVIFEK
ncbi:MAG: hypothetical protein ABIK90_05015 [candidate division WOR-3 bacterium]